VRQVDAAVAAVEQALERTPADVTAGDVRRLGFSLRHHGYEIADVDSLLDGLERRCVEAELRAQPPQQLADRAVRALDALRDSTGARDTARFRRVSRLRRGYDVGQVDALLARCLAGLELLRGAATGPVERPAARPDPDAVDAGSVDPDSVDPDSVDADAVRDTVFRRRRHGYREEPVDRAFDEVVDLLVRRDVLRERLVGEWTPPARPTVTPEPAPAEGSSRTTG
jgi:DivIVA domain-containing protein